MRNIGIAVLAAGCVMVCGCGGATDGQKAKDAEAYRHTKSLAMAQVLAAAVQYMDEHGDIDENGAKWPDSLERVARYLKDPSIDLRAYKYLKPSMWVDSRETAWRVVLVEKLTGFGGGQLTGFADGHVIFGPDLAGGERAAASVRPLSQDESALLRKIAAMNRANYEKVSSFECEYTRRMSGPLDGSTTSQTVVKGKWAFKGNKAYVREQWSSTQEEATFVRNGNMAWGRSKYPDHAGLVQFGDSNSSGIRPPMPDPLSMMDDGTARRIDRLDPNSRWVSSVRQVEIDGRRMIEVTINNRGEGADGSPVTFPVKIFYSVSEGYLSVRSECDFVSPPSQGIDIHQLTKTDILKMNVNGSDLFVPVSYTLESRFHGQESFTIDVNILPESIRINTELPDDLFVMHIEPDDHVTNLDILPDSVRINPEPDDQVTNLDLMAKRPAAIKEFKAKYGGGKLVKAPQFEIEHWFSKPVSEREMEAKVILFDFWNVGCKPCEKSLPKVQSIYEEYGPKGLVVIGLAGGPTKVTAEFLKKHGYTFPAGRETGQTWLNFAIEGVPSYFMIDKQGRLAWGPKYELPDANEIERLLEAAGGN